MSDISSISIYPKNFELSVKEKGILSYKISGIAQLAPFASTFHLKLEELTSSYDISLTINCIHTNFFASTSHKDFIQGLELILEDIQLKIKKWKETRFKTHPLGVEPVDVNEIL